MTDIFLGAVLKTLDKKFSETPLDVFFWSFCTSRYHFHLLFLDYSWADAYE